jgi:hypothetical protein
MFARGNFFLGYQCRATTKDSYIIISVCILQGLLHIGCHDAIVRQRVFGFLFFFDCLLSYNALLVIIIEEVSLRQALIYTIALLFF